MTKAQVSSTSALPGPVRWSVRCWLAAVGAGVLEALINAVSSSDYNLAVQLPVRFVIYLLVVLLVLRLRGGHNWVRIALTVLLGGLGTLSLVAEPVSWWLAGGSPTAFLAAADGVTLAVVAVRIAHLVAVVTALVLMYRPASNRYFRRRQPRVLISGDQVEFRGQS